MDEHSGDLRFMATTRGRILALLRRADRTVDELAQALDLADNTVRAHLAALGRDGLVGLRGLRRGARRPAHVYTLTPQAGSLFPRAVDDVLIALLTVLQEELPLAQVQAVLGALARRLAAQHARPGTGDLRARLAAATTVLNHLGGLVELEEEQGAYVICGYSCPLGEVTATRPELCGVLAGMVAAIADVPVEAHCVRSEPAPCKLQTLPA